MAVSNLNDDKLSILMFAYAIPTKILNDAINKDIVTSANSPMIRETCIPANPIESNASR